MRVVVAAAPHCAVDRDFGIDRLHGTTILKNDFTVAEALFSRVVRDLTTNRTQQAHSMIIAIDGPAASGKGTLARRIAAHFNLGYLDTGSLYRAVARDIRRMGGSLEDAAYAARVARALDASTLSDPSLRDPGVGDAASIVAKIPEVRLALTPDPNSPSGLR